LCLTKDYVAGISYFSYSIMPLLSTTTGWVGNEEHVYVFTSTVITEQMKCVHYTLSSNQKSNIIMNQLSSL